MSLTRVLPKISTFELPRKMANGEFSDDDDYDPERELTPEEEVVWRITREKTYRAIGHFIQVFAGVEFTFRFYLGHQVKLPAEYQDLVITHDFALLCTAVQQVFSQDATAEQKDRLKKLIGRAREYNDLRVKVVHGTWVPFERGGTLMHVSRQTLKNRKTTEMAQHLEQKANEMFDFNVELQGFFIEDMEVFEAVSEGDDQNSH